MFHSLSPMDRPFWTAGIFLTIPLGPPSFFLMIPRSFLVIPLAIPRIFSMFHSRSKSKGYLVIFVGFSHDSAPLRHRNRLKTRKSRDKERWFFSSFHSPALPAARSDRST